MKKWFRRTLWTVGFLAAASVSWRIYYIHKSDKMFEERMSKYTLVKETNAFVEAAPRVFVPSGKTLPLKRIVLFLHGFVRSPKFFQLLTDELEQQQLAYYAPRLLAHGINSQHLLQVIQKEDWLRDGIEAFDFASKLADKVDIVGHSLGGYSAAEFLRLRKDSPKVGLAVLLSPNFAVTPSRETIKSLTQIPVLSDIVLWVKPYASIPSTMEYEFVIYDHDPFPTSSIKSLWEMQDLNTPEALGQIKAEEVHVFMTPMDSLSGYKEVREKLEASGLKHEFHTLENATHAFLDDKDRKEKAEMITKILLK